ncbi:transposase family protein [Acaryochloris sp. 'Moss Beach']|nr:transposase family protein [Acaryochloris sp. 'Moss Beach']
MLCPPKRWLHAPLCGSVAHRVHSRYQRTLADLPCLHFSLSLLVLVCKFFCPNSECRRRIFYRTHSRGGGTLGQENRTPGSASPGDWVSLRRCCWFSSRQVSGLF